MGVSIVPQMKGVDFRVGYQKLCLPCASHVARDNLPLRCYVGGVRLRCINRDMATAQLEVFFMCHWGYVSLPVEACDIEHALAVRLTMRATPWSS